MMNELKNKDNLRQSSRAKRNRFGDEYIRCASDHACDLILKTREFSSAKTILIYYPIKNEISPLPLMEKALQMGKSVAFPVCDKENRMLIFKKATSISEMKEADFGLLEPNECCTTVTPDENTLCIVPALLFSRDGYRLGYGGGYYDRFLKNFNGISAGLCYDELLYDSLPHEMHDIQLDMIISDCEVLYIVKKN
jgi:5-formyltetrahydrofolate cyclo-ligase